MEFGMPLLKPCAATHVGVRTDTEGMLESVLLARDRWLKPVRLCDQGFGRCRMRLFTGP